MSSSTDTPLEGVLRPVETSDVLYDPLDPAGSLERAFEAAGVEVRQNLAARRECFGQSLCCEWRFFKDGEWETDPAWEQVVRRHVTSRWYEAKPSAALKRAKRSAETRHGHAVRKGDELATDSAVVAGKIRALRGAGFDDADPTIGTLVAQLAKMEQKRAHQRATAERLRVEMTRLETDVVEDRRPVSLGNRKWATTLAEVLNRHGYDPAEDKADL